MPKTVGDKMNISELRTRIKEALHGKPVQRETISRQDLKEVIKATLRTILNEMNRSRRIPLSMLEEAISHEDIASAWREDQSGEYVQINPDDSVWYVAHGRAKEQIVPKGTGQQKFPIIKNWMEKNHIFFNIWGVNDHGNVELYNRRGQALGGLAEQLYEMTTTGAIAPINLPGNVKGGWVASKGGSARGVAGSKSLGYELTPIGKKDMARKQDSVYE
jgi:nucleoid DNA-binding protein